MELQRITKEPSSSSINFSRPSGEGERWSYFKGLVTCIIQHTCVCVPIETTMHAYLFMNETCQTANWFIVSNQSLTNNDSLSLGGGPYKSSVHWCHTALRDQWLQIWNLPAHQPSTIVLFLKSWLIIWICDLHTRQNPLTVFQRFLSKMWTSFDEHFYRAKKDFQKSVTGHEKAISRNTKRLLFFPWVCDLTPQQLQLQPGAGVDYAMLEGRGAVGRCVKCTSCCVWRCAWLLERRQDKLRGNSLEVEVAPGELLRWFPVVWKSSAHTSPPFPSGRTTRDTKPGPPRSLLATAARRSSAMTPNHHTFWSF